jgi:YidC/Oxa1 family membrane protein insertase
MDSNKRTFIALILILGVFVGFQYLSPKGQAPVQQPTEQQPAAALPEAGLSPEQPAALAAAQPQKRAVVKAAAPQIPAVQSTIETEDFRAVFSNQGACLVEYSLKGYKLPDGQMVQFIPENGRALTMDIAVNGAPLDLSQQMFTLAEEDEGSVTYRLKTADGLTITKRYAALPGRKGLALNIGFDNQGDAILGPRYDLVWDCGLNFTEKDLKIDENEYAAVSMLDRKLETDKAQKLAKPEISQIEGSIVFSGVRTKYFVAAMVPVNKTAAAVKQGINEGRVSSRLSLKAESSGYDSIAVYLGPIHHRMLAAVHPRLDVVADTGWKPLQPVNRAILWLLLFLQKFIPNYGLVIILFSIIIKVAFFPLSYKGMKSMKHMQQLQPKMKKIQEQYKKDPGKLNQETMALYKKHGVNPLGGCLPLLLQMPVFFALYSVLANTIELRQAPFIFWINDLAVKDPYYVLPALMGIAMFFQQKMTTVDPKQKFMIYLMPPFMVFIFSSLPAGLNLYWLIYNILSIGEQYIIHIRHKPIGD